MHGKRWGRALASLGMGWMRLNVKSLEGRCGGAVWKRSWKIGEGVRMVGFVGSVRSVNRWVRIHVGGSVGAEAWSVDAGSVWMRDRWKVGMRAKFGCDWMRCEALDKR
eukprot:Seg1543.2 transcript_id=Seg1543.2/GoldUCD/mRNA.D3Y31 product="hypothetical protein" protein_id=Seg1543.2/GoldUCD/D3Y31